MSFYLSVNKDFMVLSKNGMKLLSLGGEEMRLLTDHQGCKKKVHSLDSFDFLKLEKDNHIVFEC